jgi:hypothetical protein
VKRGGLGDWDVAFPFSIASLANQVADQLLCVDITAHREVVWGQMNLRAVLVLVSGIGFGAGGGDHRC